MMGVCLCDLPLTGMSESVLHALEGRINELGACIDIIMEDIIHITVSS